MFPASTADIPKLNIGKSLYLAVHFLNEFNMTENTLISALLTCSQAEPDRKFVTLPDGRTLSFGDFFSGARRLATAIAGLGVQPGDRVAVQVEKSIEALQLYVGTIMAGGIFLPLNPAYTKDEIGYFLNDGSPTVFVCDPSRVMDLKPVVAAAGIKSILTLDAHGGGSLVAIADTLPDTFKPVPRGPEDLAAILYTSGTTGRSKGAMLSHRALVANSRTLADIWRFTKDDVLIHALPIFHTHGLFVATNVALMAGASILFEQKFDADRVIGLLPDATAMMGVPTFYTRLLDHPGLTKTATKNMRLFISGSAPLLAETYDRWLAKTGHAILERYGMTETNMNTSNPYDGDRRAGTVGFALPDVEVKICDAKSGADLPTGEIGILEVRGPNVFSGYWQMPEKTAEELRQDGFFITGDLAVIDEDGYISIVGRSKDLIITGGFNVYPKEVEAVIDNIAGVKESAVIGLPHADFGEAVVAIIVLDNAALLTPEDIAKAMANKLAKFKQPKRFEFVTELPRNTLGKVQKNVLRQMF